MAKLDIIINSLNKDIYSIDFIKKLSTKQIDKFEKINNYHFPDDYKYFLINYNWIEIWWIELLWINIDDSNIIDINDIIRKEVSKSNNPIPDFLIPFSSNWRGDYYCINKKDNKIYFWQHDCYESSLNPDIDNDNFTNWLIENIELSMDNLKD